MQLLQLLLECKISLLLSLSHYHNLLLSVLQISHMQIHLHYLIPRDAVAAIRAQLAAGPQPIPVNRRYDNQTASSSNVPLGSAGIAQLRAQAQALGTC